MKVLIIEDSQEIVDAVSLCLQIRWPAAEISFAVEGCKALEMLESDFYDIVILDVNLPDKDGFQVLSELREFTDVPVIILTVRNREHDKATGLELGADDYIVKPFNPVDLVARVNALLRRSQTPRDSKGDDFSITCGKLTLHVASQGVQLRGNHVKLSPVEWKLLYLLVSNAERTVNAEEIFQGVWGGERRDTESLRTYIRRLRTKLRDNPPQMILTDHGEGYRFVSPR